MQTAGVARLRFGKTGFEEGQKGCYEDEDGNSTDAKSSLVSISG